LRNSTYAGCESSQSISRSSFRRPHVTAGYPRCERSPDTLCWYAASSRVARLTFLAAATFAIPFFMRWQRWLYCLRKPSSRRHTVCTLSTSSMRRKRLPCLPIGPPLAPFARAVFAWNQFEIAGNLLATGEARDIAHRDHERQRRNRTYSRLCHQQTCPFIREATDPTIPETIIPCLPQNKFRNNLRIAGRPSTLHCQIPEQSDITLKDLLAN
jgi:hypothetical protein